MKGTQIQNVSHPRQHRIGKMARLWPLLFTGRLAGVHTHSEQKKCFLSDLDQGKNRGEAVISKADSISSVTPFRAETLFCGCRASGEETQNQGRNRGEAIISKAETEFHR
jgi:hypothetical protein